MKWITCFAVLAALAACRSEAEPTVTQIEEGYRILAQKNLEDAIAHFGSEEKIPSIPRALMSAEVEVESPVCEKNPSDLGHLCTYNLIVVYPNGKRLDPVIVKARVWEGPEGWQISEYE